MDLSEIFKIFQQNSLYMAHQLGPDLTQKLPELSNAESSGAVIALKARPVQVYLPVKFQLEISPQSG